MDNLTEKNIFLGKKVFFSKKIFGSSNKIPIFALEYAYFVESGRTV